MDSFDMGGWNQDMGGWKHLNHIGLSIGTMMSNLTQL
jgi:hypothetical protein